MTPDERIEKPRSRLQKTCWDCGHVFVEDDEFICAGCAVKRRIDQRIDNLMAEQMRANATRMPRGDIT